MAELSLVRFHSTKTYTGGLLLGDADEFLCFTLEDAHQFTKIPGETRIPKGRYRVELRAASPTSAKYAKKFDYHKGMLWLRDVEGFEFIYMHIGNKVEDTKGCILLGEELSTRNATLGLSAHAYERVYKHILNLILQGEVWITIFDEVFSSEES